MLEAVWIMGFIRDKLGFVCQPCHRVAWLVRLTRKMGETGEVQYDGDYTREFENKRHNATNETKRMLQVINSFSGTTILR